MDKTYWRDVSTNLVAFGIVIVGIYLVEALAGRRIGFLRTG